MKSSVCLSTVCSRGEPRHDAVDKLRISCMACAVSGLLEVMVVVKLRSVKVGQEYAGPVTSTASTTIWKGAEGSFRFPKNVT